MPLVTIYTGGILIYINEIVEKDNYYPFGMKHSGYNNVPRTDRNIAAQRYKYNNKELQDELGLNWYDYEAHNYDLSLGRWFNIDPLAEKSRRFSPYTYALNNPVYFIDPDGMEATAGLEDMDLGRSRYRYSSRSSCRGSCGCRHRCGIRND